MMRAALAFAGLTLRTAVRSRVVVSMLFLLAFAVLVVPLTVKGDGTLRAEFQIMLTYSLGLAWVVLSVVTLWSGCAAVSLEVETRRIQMTLSKPVPRHAVWIGKWLGLLALNAVLLVVTGLSVLGVVSWRTRAERLSDDERVLLKDTLLTTLRDVPPELPDLLAEARKSVADDLASGALEMAGRPEARARERARQMEIRRNSAEPGAVVTWRFSLPENPPEDGDVFIHLRSEQASMTGGELPLLMLIGTSANPRQLRMPFYHTPGAAEMMVLPRDGFEGERDLVVEVFNGTGDGRILVFDPRHNIRLRYAYGHFQPNLARALVVMFCHLALLAAIGITAGTLFSFPVAALLALSLVFLMQLSGFIQGVARDGFAMGSGAPGEGASALIAVVHLLYRGLDAVLAPLQSANPLESLSSGILVSWSLVASELFWRAGIASLIFGVIGVIVFRRREVGMPQ